MAWKNDFHGKVFQKISEIKVYPFGHHSWAMKLSQLPRQHNFVHIATYNFANIKTVQEILDKRHTGISILCHKKFINIARQIKNRYPAIEIATIDKFHSKVVLVSPDIVYLGSPNFGKSGWIESTVGIRDREVYKFYKENYQNVWKKDATIVIKNKKNLFSDEDEIEKATKRLLRI